MATSSDIQKRKMLEALEKSMGIVTAASKKSGIARSTHYDWMKGDEEYRKEVEGLADVALDFAESRLMKSIANGSDTATIFYLKTKGKVRGYIERTEVTGKDGEKLQPQPIMFLSADKLTPEQIEKYMIQDAGPNDESI